MVKIDKIPNSEWNKKWIHKGEVVGKSKIDGSLWLLLKLFDGERFLISGSTVYSIKEADNLP